MLDKTSALPPGGRFARLWPKLKRARHLAFVGRGPFYAVATDAALKFREMAGVHAAAYSAADFLHGPVGACGPDDLIFLLSPSASQIPADLAQVRRGLRLRQAPHALLAPSAGKAPLSCLLLDVELKLAALALAVDKGLDPDHPRGLKKVTKTI